MKVSMCTDIFFPGQPTHEVLPLLKEAGYTAFEFWSWNNKDTDAIAAAMEQTGLTLAAFCTKNNNLVDPAQRDGYIAGLKETLPIAKKLNCRTLISTVGQRMEELSDEEQTQSIIDGLTAAAPLLEESGVTIVLEPLNILVNHEGYFLDRSDKAFDILKKVDSPNVKLLFDVYHQQITEGNLIANITAHIDLIGHFHSADVPGRHDLGSGEINWANIKKAIEGTDYDGYFGLEYSAIGDRTDSMTQALKILS